MLLDFGSDDLCVVADKNKEKYADMLEQVEEKYSMYNNRALLEKLIPLVRRHGELAYFEEGIYTPTKDQKNYGISFKAIKMMNPDQNVSKFIAIALDPKYESVDKMHCTAGTIYGYNYTFDF